MGYRTRYKTGKGKRAKKNKGKKKQQKKTEPTPETNGVVTLPYFKGANKRIHRQTHTNTHKIKTLIIIIRIKKKTTETHWYKPQKISYQQLVHPKHKIQLDNKYMIYDAIPIMH